ncbi:MAG TPA: ABC transporter permease [Candidatus Cybelea sp.]|nr:ABC transporter permease [Candidatus Cybelea sp.]
MLRGIWIRMRALFGREAVEGELSDELGFHFEQQVEKYIRAGMGRGEAARRARLEFGGLDQVKEDCRDARGVHVVESLTQDVRYALTSLQKNPGFAAVALLTIALGVGATTVMFTVVNAVLLKPLPYPEASGLIVVHAHTEGWNTRIFGEQKFSYPDFLDCQRESRSMEMAAVVFNNGTVSEPEPPAYVDNFEISSNLFSVLRVPLGKGRPFLPEEDRLGSRPVAILSYSFWQHQFGGRPDALGGSLVLDQKRYTIVGIAPAGLKQYGYEPDVYTPVGQDGAGYLRKREAQPVHVVARLGPEVTLGQAQAEIAQMGRHLAEQYATTNAGRSFLVHPLRPEVGNVGSTLWLLLGAVTLVLLIACANVASLLLARAVSRERELAMRAVLGASKWRLVEQCLTESAVLGLAGGALGILCAYAGVGHLVALWPGSLPRGEEVHIDWRVLAFAISVSMLSGILFGLAPAVRTPTRELEQMLRAGASTVLGSSRRLHSAFVTVEVSIAFVLLVAAGMLGRTLLRVSSLDAGLKIQNLLTMRVALSPATLSDPARIPAAWQDLLERARHVPGVQSVAAVDIVPLREGNNQLGYWTTPDVPPKNKQPMALASSATPDYLKATGIPLLRGRFIGDEDRLDALPVIVVDDVLARDAFGTDNVLGKRLWMPDMPCVEQKVTTGPDGRPVKTVNAFVDCKEPYTIVGVVGHVRYWGLASDDQAQVRGQVYYPLTQVPAPFLRRWSELMSIVVRTNVAPLSVVASLREALRGATGDQVLYEVRTMEQLTSDSLGLHRFLLTLFGVFAGLALLLACVGIYGVLAYLTSRRVPEIGVRMALGATPARVMQMVIGQSLRMILFGIGAGFLAAVAAARVLIHAVSGMRPLDGPTFAVVFSLLAAAALLASVVPARRASRIDPMAALRQE